MRNSPPKILEWILEAFLRYDDHEAVLGDFEQQFSMLVQIKGSFRAHLWYCFQIMTSTPRFLKSHIIWLIVLFKSYFKSAIRNIKKYRGFSFINILGLLGISIYNVETKTKEIGIRKVLGANVISVVWFFNREFLLLIAISSVIVAPIALYMHDLALRRLANRAELTVIDIGLGICLMLIIGLMTIISQIVKAVRVNPIETLKNE